MKPSQDADRSPRGARRRAAAVIATGLSAALVVALLVLPARKDAGVPEQAAAPAGAEPAYDLAQAMNCETPAGVCQLAAPQPVGSLCQCPGGSTGRAIL